MRFGGALLALLFFTAPVRAGDPASFAGVVRQARQLAAAPFQPNDAPLPPELRQLDYDSYRKITFRRERGLWFDSQTPFQVQFSHPGYLFDHPVVIHAVEEGKIRDLPFSPKYFRYPEFDPAPLGHHDSLGFAGFRLLYQLNQPGKWDEVISFIGSDYFRALGAGQVYGMSARGVAIDTGENLAEEFPSFREFWLCRPKPGAKQMQFFALLDGSSVAGAYLFLVSPGKETRVEIEAHLFFRRPVQALGIAPLTTMFWRGEKEPLPPNDARPEVHDSDGLMVNAEDWHPLAPVQKVTTQVFPADHPRSFALLQRDRDASHYRDDEAHYEERPSVRVESLGDWGGGSVRLVQLPTQNEYSDNVVAFWQPEKLPQAGDELDFKYRLDWFKRASNKP